MNEKLTFPDLVARLATATGTTELVSELFLKELFAVASKALIAGESVKIKGIGTFNVAKVNARRSVDVNTGENIEIPEHNKISFTPDKELADAINEPFAAFDTIILSDEFSEDLIQLSEQHPTAEEVIESSPTDENEEDLDNNYEEIAEDTHTQQVTSEEKIDEEKQEIELPPPFPQPQEIVIEEEKPQENLIEEEVVTVEEPISPPQEKPQEETTQEEAETHHEQPLEEKPQNEEIIKEENETPVAPVINSELDIEQALRKSTIKGFLWGVLVTLLACAIATYLLLPHMSNWGNNSDVTIDDDTLIADSTLLVEEDTSQAIAEPEKPTVVTDTVSAQMVLFRMARKHYGDPNFWVYIYEENKHLIKDPNNVSPGTVLVIPPAEKYGIDPNDKQSLDEAKRKSFAILSNYE